MLSQEALAELRSIFNDVCQHLSAEQSDTKGRVAKRLLECARQGNLTREQLRYEARRELPTGLF